jgi:hypothetical protein
MMSVVLSLFRTLGTLARSRSALQLEILALRSQLEVLQRTRPRRVRLAKTDRCLWVLLAHLWTTMATVDELIRVGPSISSGRRGAGIMTGNAAVLSGAAVG